MDDINQSSSIKESDLLLTIWTKPKQTLEFILQNCPKKYVTALLILGGITDCLNRSASKNNGTDISFIIILILVILFGGLVGWLFSYIYAFLLSWTGEWLKGRAEYDKFIIVIAWANVPIICSLVLWVFKLVIFRDQLFNIDTDSFTGAAIFLYYSFGIIDLILGIWATVILVKGIALIQNFTIGKAILNMILPGIVLAVPILVIMGIMFIVHK